MSQTLNLLSPVEAWEMMQQNANALLIDVRTDMEFLMIGHPVGAIHIPWMDAPDWTINPRFVAEVRKLLLGRSVEQCHSQDSCTCLLLLCRSSNRSKAAARLLADQGVENIFVVEGGFEGPLDENHHRSTLAGWRKEGLPWEQC